MLRSHLTEAAPGRSADVTRRRTGPSGVPYGRFACPGSTPAASTTRRTTSARTRPTSTGTGSPRALGSASATGRSSTRRTRRPRSTTAPTGTAAAAARHRLWSQGRSSGTSRPGTPTCTSKRSAPSSSTVTSERSGRRPVKGRTPSGSWSPARRCAGHSSSVRATVRTSAPSWRTPASSARSPVVRWSCPASWRTCLALTARSVPPDGVPVVPPCRPVSVVALARRPRSSGTRPRPVRRCPRTGCSPSRTGRTRSRRRGRSAGTGRSSAGAASLRA